MLAVDISEPHVTALVRIRKLRVIESDETQNGRIDIVNAERRFLGAKAELVTRTKHLTTLNTGACHPHAECIRMMVPTVLSFGERRPAEFAAPYNQRRIEQTARFEIGQKTRDRKIGLLAHLRMGSREIGVRVVPIFADVRAGVELDEAHATLDHAAGQQALPSEVVRDSLPDAVELLRRVGLLAEIDCFRRRTLHAIRKFVGRDAGLEFGIVTAWLEVQPVLLIDEIERRALRLRT